MCRPATWAASVQPAEGRLVCTLLGADPARSAGLCPEKDSDKLQSSLGRKQTLEGPPGEGRMCGDVVETTNPLRPEVTRAEVTDVGGDAHVGELCSVRKVF